MKESKVIRFVEFLMTDDLFFRLAIFYLPLIIAIGTFFLQWLVRGKSVTESIFSSAFIFLIVCFIGVVGEAVKRGNLR